MQTEVATLEIVLRELKASLIQGLDPAPPVKKVKQCFAAIACSHPNAPLGASIDQFNRRPDLKRTGAIVLIRALEFAHPIFSNPDEPDARWKFVQLCQDAVPDLCKHAGINKQDQTYAAFDKLCQLLPAFRGRLEQLRLVEGRPESVIASRQNILRILKFDPLKAFLAPYFGEKTISTIEEILSRFDALQNSSDPSFPQLLENLQSFVSSQIVDAKEHTSFLNEEYVLPLLTVFQEAIENLREDSRDRFLANIELDAATNGLLEKRYPLEEPERELRLTIPFKNTGRGEALDTTFTVIADKSISFNSDVIRVGNIKPGPFALSIDALIVEPSSSIAISVETTWNEIGLTATKKIEFSVEIRAQPTGVDWRQLEEMDPYSTEIATGAEFIGRENKVRSVVSRLSKARMASSYITGQKRVGKSSLAHAVRDRLLESSDGDRYRFKYLEWGEYAHSTAEGTLQELGERLSDFLCSELPPELRPTGLSFSGSLAPLVKVLNTLSTIQPALKFIIILDEFDSIHPELYRMGSLADTFFANLRSLAARPNMGELSG